MVDVLDTAWDAHVLTHGLSAAIFAPYVSAGVLEVAYRERRYAQALLSNPACPTKAVTRLAHDLDAGVARAARRHVNATYALVADDEPHVWTHPDCPPDRVHAAFATYTDSELADVPLELLTSPHLNAAELEALLWVTNNARARVLLANPALVPDQAHRLLARFPTADRGLGEAFHLYILNPNADPDWLTTQLNPARSEDRLSGGLEAAILRNPNLPLASWTASVNRAGVASRSLVNHLAYPHIPTETLLRLARTQQHPNHGIYALATHPNATRSILDHLETSGSYLGDSAAQLAEFLLILQRWCTNVEQARVAVALSGAFTGSYGELLAVVGGILAPN